MNKKLGVIVPYRDRYEQLIQFKKHINQYLTKTGIDYELIIVEQDDAQLFNRGKLLNIGFKYAKKLKCDYVVFHDVDMLPIDADYSWSDFPVHMATDFIPSNTRIIFDEYFGGVTMFPSEDFLRINGYSNEYWGWGFEDDDLLYRCKLHELPLRVINQPQPGGHTTALRFNGQNSFVESEFDFNKLAEISIFVSFCSDKMLLNHLEYDDTFVIFANSHLRITYNSYSRYNFELKDGNGNIHYINSDIKQIYKTNICVTIDKENKKFKMYQDGILLDIKNYEIDFKFDDKTFYLGKDVQENYFNGIINEFAIYDSVLIDEEILDISNNKYFGLTSNFGNYQSEHTLRLYYNPKIIKNYKLIDLVRYKHNGVINGCEITGYTFDDFKSKQVPHRRNSTFELMSHNENGYVGNGWKEITTRYNQLKYHNEVTIGYKDTKNDGLNNCNFKEHSYNHVNNQSHIVVQL
jgi:hypothetical protein